MENALAILVVLAVAAVATKDYVECKQKGAEESFLLDLVFFGFLIVVAHVVYSVVGS